VLTGLFLAPFVRVLSRVGDEGSVVYGAQRVAEGALPYRDFFEVMGPASFWWLGLFFRLFGPSFLVARVLLLLTGVSTALLVYWIARKTTPGAGDWWPALMVTVASIPLWPATSHHWDSNLFFLGGVALFLQSRAGDRRGYLIASGIAVGLTACFMPEKGAYLAIALTVTLALVGGTAALQVPLTKALMFLMASAAPVLAVALFYAAHGALGAIVHATLLWPLSNYSAINVIPYARWTVDMSAGCAGSALPFLPVPFRVILAVAALPAGVIFATLPAIVPFLGFLAFRLGHVSRTLLEQALPVCLSAAALYLSEVHRPDFFHLVYGAPLLLVSVVLVGRATFPSKAANRSFWLLLAAPALVWGGALIIGATRASIRVETRRGPVFVEKRDEALDALLITTAPRSCVFVYPYYPMYYFLADLVNPTRYTILEYGYNTPEQLQEVADDIAKRRVELVLWDAVVSGKNLTTWFPNYREPPPEDQVIEKVLETRYEEYSRKSDWRFLRLRHPATTGQADRAR
jgi:hypothetical protein